MNFSLARFWSILKSLQVWLLRYTVEMINSRYLNSSEPLIANALFVSPFGSNLGCLLSFWPCLGQYQFLPCDDLSKRLLGCTKDLAEVVAIYRAESGDWTITLLMLLPPLGPNLLF